MRRILVTGARGQIGVELTLALRKRYGAARVVASDLAEAQPLDDLYERLDCMQADAVADLMRRRDIDVVYHLAALLSAVAEDRPQAAWSVNMSGLYNVLEAARRFGCQVFFPSSIAAFGPSTPRRGTPQITIQRPTTIYGVTKVAGELLCDYYATRFGVDARGLRLPGLVSSAAPPGGGTTDYAVEMFRAAALRKRYSCFLAAETRLDMMYMPDATRAIMELMEAKPERLRFRNAYNVTGMSVTPREIAAEICKHAPTFAVDYRIDPLRQAIADSWPQSLDANAAREDWGFAPRFDLAAMTRDMLVRLGAATDPFDDPNSDEVPNANAGFG
ncbi:NAD-dependent epimerase/dehydratase family protein [Methylocystis hirsuta]|uniref:NAD-dependent epimerase/dehydratase family protein n=1 Tax=Methylocystis hirsuta TaxID=369798 RepID=A0A3M9XLY8_9HYPH|nr:NAD-dependent epimerase/dehydratase family protein [Methylocystis hirsuta]RNJ49011.1 NAD-dependent epimerase/dehydratase family protein [Methylocystis hirsuta]